MSTPNFVIIEQEKMKLVKYDFDKIRSKLLAKKFFVYF